MDGEEVVFVYKLDFLEMSGIGRGHRRASGVAFTFVVVDGDDVVMGFLLSHWWAVVFFF